MLALRLQRWKVINMIFESTVIETVKRRATYRVEAGNIAEAYHKLERGETESEQPVACIDEVVARDILNVMEAR